MANLISTTGPVCPNVTDTPLDNRSRVSTIVGIGNIPLAWRGMLVYCEENGKTYKVTSLKSKTSGPVVIDNYYPATWVEFGSGGSTPSLASDILGLTEDIHNINGNIGTLRSLNTEYKNDLVGAINEVLTSTGSTIAVVNNLLSNSTTDALSAYQGKVLKGLVDGKVAGIKVQGESSVLPMVDGIVTIPAGGGGGTGTITGATVGGSPVTESGGILQFDAYPTVPEVPITSIAKKTDDTNPISPSQGRVNLDLTAEDIAYNSSKTVKGKLNDIDKLIKDLTPDPSNNESSSTIIDLSLYSEWEDDESEYHSFVYNSSAIYVYSTSSTSQVKVTSNNTPHAIFKVSDRDIYIDYIVSTSGDDIIYTANAIYDSSTLPSDFKKQFELGVYALIYRIIGRSGDIIPYGKTIIADTDNKVLNVAYRDVVDNNVTKHQLITRAFDKGRIYIYETPDATYTKGYKFKTSYGTADSGFSDLNKLFGGGGDASDIEFDDSVTRLSIPGYPVNNVQTAIQLIATKVYGFSSTLIITLIYSNGNRIANKWFDISSTFQGNSYDFSSQLNDADNAQYVTTVDGVKKFKTNSNGECRIGLPVGATYNIVFHSIANFATPNDISGIADSTTCNISASYTALSLSEEVLIKVLMVNVSNTVNPNNKKVYIDLYDNNNEIDVSKYYEITVNSAGLVSSVKRKNDNSDTYSTISDNSISIDQGRRYRVYLEDWEGYNAEITSIIISQNVNRVVVLKYTYLLSGTYILLNDIYNPLGYESCKVLDIDTTNNKIKIIKNVNGTEGNYWIYHKSNNGIYMYGEFEDTSSEIELISEQNINTTFAGIGLRNQELNTTSLSENSLSGTCAFFITPGLTVTSTGIPHPRYVNSAYDGQSNCDSLVGLDTPSYPVYDTVHSNTCTLGNNTYNAFLPSYRQFLQIVSNYDSFVSIFSIFGKTMYAVKTDKWAISTYQEADYIHYFNNGSIAAKVAYYASPTAKFLPIFSF